MMSDLIIDVGRDFSRRPVGRESSVGNFSGERFLKQFLLPALSTTQGTNRVVVIDFNNVTMAGGAFLEEVFGGLFRTDPPVMTSMADFKSRIRIVSESRHRLAASIDQIVQEAITQRCTVQHGNHL